ncbi:MAG: hypothetical protein K6T83_10405 [Alicyclobacillus sp.]|nr:hypothetical protein [Alicyclobacillus sp.]
MILEFEQRYSQVVLQEATNRYGDHKSVISIGAFRSADNLLGEVEWILHLANHEVPESRCVPSIHADDDVILS